MSEGDAILIGEMNETPGLARWSTDDGRLTAYARAIRAGADTPQDRQPPRQRVERKFRADIARGGPMARVAAVALDLLRENTIAVKSKSTAYGGMASDLDRISTARPLPAPLAYAVATESRPPREVARPTVVAPSLLDRAPRAPGLPAQRTA